MAQRADPGADARTEARGGGVVAITIVVVMALAVVALGLGGAFSHGPRPGDALGPASDRHDRPPARARSSRGPHLPSRRARVDTRRRAANLLRRRGHNASAPTRAWQLWQPSRKHLQDADWVARHRDRPGSKCERHRAAFRALVPSKLHGERSPSSVRPLIASAPEARSRDGDAIGRRRPSHRRIDRRDARMARRRWTRQRGSNVDGLSDERRRRGIAPDPDEHRRSRTAWLDPIAPRSWSGPGVFGP